MGYTSDLTQGKTFSASSVLEPGFEASKAFDNNDATRWSSAYGSYQWLRVDFGTPVAICKVVYRPSAAYKSDVLFQGSNDGTYFTTIYTLTGMQNYTTKTYEFTNTTEYRYYRIYLLYTNTYLNAATLEMYAISATVVVIDASGSGEVVITEIISGGSTAEVEIEASGRGVGIPLYLTISIDENKNITIDKRIFAVQGEKILALIDVDESLWNYGKYAQFNVLLPNGIIENKGLYEYSEEPFYVFFNDGDTILSNDGLIKLQASFIKYADDGMTEIVTKKSKIHNTRIYRSVKT